MSQNPQDSNFYDYNPEYGNLNQQNAQNGQYGQPMMVPVGIVQKTPEQLAGEKAGLQLHRQLMVVRSALLDPGCYWYLQGERGRALRRGCFGWSHHELD